MRDLKKGDAVTWSWGSGIATGRIAEVFHERVERTIKGKDITRNASREEPAYLVVQEDGDEVL